MDYAENYMLNFVDQYVHSTVSHDKSFGFFILPIWLTVDEPDALVSQALISYFDYFGLLGLQDELCIFNSFVVRNYYDQKNTQLVPPQSQNKHLHIVTDNAGNQCKNVYQNSCIIDYVNKGHALETIQHNFSCEARKAFMMQKEVCFGH